MPDSTSSDSVSAIYRDGSVRFKNDPGWPDGTPLVVAPVVPLRPVGDLPGHVIVAGFGLAGRFVVDLLDHAKLSFTIIERNPVTVETQKALGRNIIEADVTDSKALIEAGLSTASILALTIPDEDAVLKATSLARRLRPEIYIIARTNYSSKGMQASQLGADDVIKAEQAVALQFFDRLRRRLVQMTTEDQAPTDLLPKS